MESTYAPFQTECSPFLELSLAQLDVTSLNLCHAQSPFCPRHKLHVTPQNPGDVRIDLHQPIRYVLQYCVLCITHRYLTMSVIDKPLSTASSRYFITFFFVRTIFILNARAIFCNGFDADPEALIDQGSPRKPRLPVWPTSTAGLSESIIDFAGSPLAGRHFILLHLPATLTVTVP